ncbi:MAG: M20/M25/M40 family metallo-hydrolase [Chloroflexi bacterium]|nr:M20/M25/M40 family metallo-hydrolase [Chloroflexota bacterium]MYD47697.1 M20/M25/M40 family metallo-hydrolase [Chloroflexota bacterium]
MTNIAHKFRPVLPALAILAILWFSVTACSPAQTGNTATGNTAADSTVVTSAPPTQTLEPTLQTADASGADALASMSAPRPTEDTAASPTAAPEASTASGQQPTASSSGLFEERTLLEERAYAYLSQLVEDAGVRTSGTDLEEAAAQYLVQTLEGLGYQPEIQEFTWEQATASLTLSEPEPMNLDAYRLDGSATGQATAVLELVGLAQPEDVPAAGLEGKIALIERGEISFADKVSRVQIAGAVAAIIYNNRPGNFRGNFGERSLIPAISLSQEEGRKLVGLMEQAEPVEVTVDVQVNTVPSRNVIAELPGAGQGIVVLGAHYDTVPDSIGASDNSSGVGVLLAIAERLHDRPLPFTLRLVAFGSEETGLRGSRHYVENLSPQELANTHLMINVDAIGSGERLVVSGDRWVVRHVVDTAAGEGVLLERSAPARLRSDHAPFRNAWVPVVSFRSDDVSRVNSPADTMEHINPRLLDDAAFLALNLLQNVDGLPGFGQ